LRLTFYDYYYSFGAVCLALNLIPVIGLLFNMTSTIGAALWASKMESTQPPPERAYEIPEDKAETVIDLTADLDES
jgi:hypothetical protein